MESSAIGSADILLGDGVRGEIVRRMNARSRSVGFGCGDEKSNA